MGFITLGKVALGALAFALVHAFVRTADDGEARRACAPLCELGPAYADDARLAPDFELPSLDHGSVKLSAFRGRVVLLNFWSKDCPPCMQELPSMAALAARWQATGEAVLLTVNVDADPEAARRALREATGGERSLPVLLDPELRVVRDLYGTRLYPETWAIDRVGVIRARFDGARDWSAPVVSSLVDGLEGPKACPVRWSGGVPKGPVEELCAF